jgi:hypothetical protein
MYAHLIPGYDANNYEVLWNDYIYATNPISLSTGYRTAIIATGLLDRSVRVIILLTGYMQGHVLE